MNIGGGKPEDIEEVLWHDFPWILVLTNRLALKNPNS